MEEKTTYLNGSLVLRDGYFESTVMWRDELQSIIAQQKNNPADRITTNYAEGTLDYKATAVLADDAVMNIQMNHGWDVGSEIHPHLHWFQAEDAVPNWMIQYRWQGNGAAKDATWKSLVMVSEAFTYVSGTLVQISATELIEPPAIAGISDILQVRVIRDTNNASGLFAGNDPYTATVGAINFDVHYQVDTNGSRQEYVK